MSLLEGDLAKQIFDGFKGRLLKGTLIRRESTGVTDENNDPVVQDVSYSCEGFIDSYDEYYRARAGIPIEDSKVGIFGSSIATIPQIDDEVTMRGQVWKIRRVMTDPALALYECQSYRIDD